ncbi:MULTISPECIES: MBL fold metallo-hydrolase [Larsenimonas]|uniref:MBL fold metallo-hydrolase n=1 Tax=Larsenimonas suaedae TaxID=1851019 RepID=A0ABU1GVS5_9GAMM|nr:MULTISPECIES: MBL fold metallo-hydrolase [Larsenimonas]MCM2971221.1 MBL fold metallo-hydrolase [Larsenimonas suaedae]MCM5703329.1 MBL fold metallo-hydrolase [Larsenimonas salina]MDR5895930.1 MBL fold metallo-hydrolase [Larsenimonas suaedae]
MSLDYLCVPVTPFAQNCTVLYCTDTLEAAIVDPGGDADRIIAAVERLGVRPTKILLTHAHLDHVGGVMDIAERFEVPVIGPHQADEPLIAALSQQASMFGLTPPRTPVIDQWLVHGDRVGLGARELAVYHCPGHAPGHVIFVDHDAGLSQTGDVLFKGSIGRTDLPGGDFDTLVHSIKTTLWSLGNDMRFVPGHGEASTIGQERSNNPFVGDHVIA